MSSPYTRRADEIGPRSDEPRIDWHRHDADRQVIVSVDGGEVRIAVALPADASRSALDAVLTDLERELDHYCGADGEGLPSRTHR